MNHDAPTIPTIDFRARSAVKDRERSTRRQVSVFKVGEIVKSIRHLRRASSNVMQDDIQQSRLVRSLPRAKASLKRKRTPQYSWQKYDVSKTRESSSMPRAAGHFGSGNQVSAILENSRGTFAEPSRNYSQLPIPACNHPSLSASIPESDYRRRLGERTPARSLDARVPTRACALRLRGSRTREDIAAFAESCRCGAEIQSTLTGFAATAPAAFLSLSLYFLFLRPVAVITTLNLPDSPPPSGKCTNPTRVLSFSPSATRKTQEENAKNDEISRDEPQTYSANAVAAFPTSAGIKLLC